jgi:hypothetical protein
MTSRPEVYMTQTKKILCAVVASWLAAGLSLADDPKGMDKGMDKTPDKSADKSADTSKSMSMMEKKSTEATVVRVDTAKRHLVLQGENGLEFTVQVPQTVKRLEDIKAGDKIKVDYYESLALSLEKAGEGASAPTNRTLTERNAGKLPGGSIAHQESGTVEIVKIDKDKNQVTVKRPSGEMDTIDIKDPELQAHLSQIKEGDMVQASYTEAAVIKIERPEGANKNQGMNKKMKPDDKMKSDEKSMPEQKAM